MKNINNTQFRELVNKNSEAVIICLLFFGVLAQLMKSRMLNKAIKLFIKYLIHTRIYISYFSY